MALPRGSVCAACRLRQLPRSLLQLQQHSSIAQPWQGVRDMSSMRRRKRASRMVLSRIVDEEKEKVIQMRRRRGPVSAINRTTFTPPRSRKRSSRIPTTLPTGRPESAVDEKEKHREDRNFHALKMQRALTSVSYGSRAQTQSEVKRIESFKDFALLPEVQQAIAKTLFPDLDVLAPTPIQRLAISHLIRPPYKNRRARRNDSDVQGQYLLAAETGSGKTLAYLLPLVDAIKRAEMQEKEAVLKAEADGEKAAESNSVPEDGYPDYGRPRAIILLPTAELVAQVGSVAKLLAHHVKFRSALISTAYSTKVIRNRLFDPKGVDLLLTTPQLLASIAESDPYVLSKVERLVVDEADSLLDRSFAPATTKIIDRVTPVMKQLVLCSATIPKQLDKYLRERYPAMQRIVSPKLHSVPRRVQLGVIDVQKPPYMGSKLLACADIIWTISRLTSGERVVVEDDLPNLYILVFVNERTSTEVVTNYLQSRGIHAISLNRDNRERKQAAILSEFVSAHPIGGRKRIDPTSSSDEEDDDDDNSETTPTKKKKKKHQHLDDIPAPAPPKKPNMRLANTRVLVSTDLGSRGIDTLSVKQVVLFDVPHTTVDFIHRLGRVGRMGRRGRGVVLVDKHDRKDIVREIKDAMFKGQALI